MAVTLQRLRTLNERVARGEGYIATAILLAMILVASGQAMLFNLAERGMAWAARVLEASTWVDQFLQKGTLWLAFLGASLAMYEDRHFAIDIVTRVVPVRVARMLRLISATLAGVIAFMLAQVFFRAALASDATVPFEYELLTAHGRVHVCDVSGVTLASVEQPTVLCALRAGLATLHIPVNTGSGITHLIAPLMFVLIGLRLLGRGVQQFLLLTGRAPSTGDAPSGHSFGADTDS